MPRNTQDSGSSRANRETPDTKVRPAAQLRQLRIDRTVADAIDAHVREDTTVEHGGVLVGSAAEVSGALTITAAIRAEGAISQAASLTFTHETWTHVNQVLDSEYPELKIVGWYHSHPGYSVFLSEYDTFIQENFFSAPWQVAYVVDPLIDQRGFFGWEFGEIVRYAEWDVRETCDTTSTPVSEPIDRPSSVGIRRLPTAFSPLSVGISMLIVGLLLGVLGGLRLGDKSSSVDNNKSPNVPADGVRRVDSKNGTTAEWVWSSIDRDNSAMKLTILLTSNNQSEDSIKAIARKLRKVYGEHVCKERSSERSTTESRGTQTTAKKPAQSTAIFGLKNEKRIEVLICNAATKQPLSTADWDGAIRASLSN